MCTHGVAGGGRQRPGPPTAQGAQTTQVPYPGLLKSPWKDLTGMVSPPGREDPICPVRLKVTSNLKGDFVLPGFIRYA